MKQTINIIWCKKNLRVIDNEILANLDPDIATIGLYFFEPSIMKLLDYSNFHLKFILESLLELQISFLKIGIKLLILPYEVTEGIEKIKKNYKISQRIGNKNKRISNKLNSKKIKT